MYKLAPLFLLSGCQLYGGMTLHDKNRDSEFKEEQLIATVGVSQDLTKNVEVYAEHLSQPTHKGDSGINHIGIKLKAELY